MKTYCIAQGTVSQYFVITYKGKESEYIYIYIYIYIYTHIHICVCVYNSIPLLYTCN